MGLASAARSADIGQAVVTFRSASQCSAAQAKRGGLQPEVENESGNETGNDRFKLVGLSRDVGGAAYQREAPAPKSTFK